MEDLIPKQRINALLGKYKVPILVILVGLALMLLPSGEETAEPLPVETTAAVGLEQQLEALLERIEGAGAVTVLLTEQEGPLTLYQTDSQTDADDSGSRRSDDTVLVEDENRRETGLVRQTLGPVYRGAVVLCQGADDPTVRLAVVEAVRCVTGLGADRISVQKMK